MGKKKQPNIHKYETDVSKLPIKCILCGYKISDDEFEYEDYYIVFRGFTPNAAKGFICFNCITEDNKPLKRGVCPYCHKKLTHPKMKEVV